VKIIIASLVSLLVGSSIGYYFGYIRPTATFARETRQQLDMYENGKTMAAAVSVDAMQYIDSGEISNAVQLLSMPIASCYCDSGLQVHTNAERLKLRGDIEQLASTNQVVAARIKEMSNSTGGKTK
jgi:hypothetical protein